MCLSMTTLTATSVLLLLKYCQHWLYHSSMDSNTLTPSSVLQSSVQAGGIYGNNGILTDNAHQLLH